MKTKKIFSTSAIAAGVLVLAGWMVPANYYHLSEENDLVRDIKKKLSAYTKETPEDRVYLQFDKTFYEPGENIWFSAYLRNAADLKPSQKSDILHVELIGPKGNVEKEIKLVAKNGKVAGDFALDAEAPGGLYKVKAYTNWQKNDSLFFEKELQVQSVVLPKLKMKLDFERKAFGAGDEVMAKVALNTNENQPLGNYKLHYVANINGKKFTESITETDVDGVKYIRFKLPKELASNDGLLNILIDYQGSTESISRSIPIVLNKISLSFFPEGGDLVNGLESNVAFRALNEFGKPADIEGVVLTSKGSQVASFSSYHMGMGSFKFIPQPGEKYTAKITKPEGIKETVVLPEPLVRGYVLNIDNSRPGEIIANVNTTENEELSLVAQVRGKDYYSTAFHAVSGNNKLIFATDKFPMGVVQITLFDNKGIERAERLAFVNKDKQLSISVSTDKEKYLPREKVKMTLNVRDERGMPIPATLSMAVVNDQLLSFADDKSGNIISELLLQQDIKEKIEEPAFYFDKKEEKADKALDYLLMTSGWRRFTWEQVMTSAFPGYAYNGERAVLSGTVIDAYTGKPVSNVSIKINNTGSGITADTVTGKFILNKVDLSNPVSLAISAPGYSLQYQQVYDYSDGLIYYLYNNNYNYSRSPRSHAKANNRRMKAAFNADGLMPVANMAAGAGMEREEKMEAPGEAAEFAKTPAPVMDRVAKKENQVMQKVATEVAAPKPTALASVDDLRDAKFGHKSKELDEEERAVPQIGYYRARQFAAPVYSKDEQPEVRNDFRSTIYWNPSVEIDRTGKKEIEFYNSDDISSFRSTVEGIGADGLAGRVEKNYFTQLPFSMSTKVPVEVVTEDMVSIPLTLINNTNKPLGGALMISTPSGLQALAEVPSAQTIMPGKAKTIYLDYKVLNKMGVDTFTVAFKSCGLKDAFSQKIKITSKGFPVNVSLSGKEMEKDYKVNISNPVNGSLKATLTAYPNVVSDLMKGVEGILREPYGCFEQTSMSSYPNAMILDYLKTTDNKNEKLMSEATALLDRGYKRLITFETKEKGYEWFGSNPGHEALTAYGLMQFNDMKKAGGKVEQSMIDRTANWLMARRDGKGGFDRSSQALDNFGRASKEVTDAYIVYALSEAGFNNIEKEFDASYKKAMETKDPYLLGLVANAAFNLKKEKEAEKAMEVLIGKQNDKGAWAGASHSITYSTGSSLDIETSSLALMAILKSGNKDMAALNKGVQFIVSSRNGYGALGNTQGTVLALKALTDFAKFSKRTSESGTIKFYVDGKEVAQRAYKAGENGAISLTGLEKYIHNGEQNLKVSFSGTKEPLPYSVAVSWNTTLPNSSKECVVALNTRLDVKTAHVGETVRFTATLKNNKAEGIPSTMVIIGIPAGLSVLPWQLKELQEKKVFDYYEIIGNNIALYYRCMAPSDLKTIHLDLKAEIPGEYDAPASSGYLYYTNEFKSWSATDKIKITKG